MSELLYRLPFDTKNNPVRISQGRRGPWSHYVHKNSSGGFVTDLENAVDFALPLGTPVLAARAGRVFHRQLESDLYYEGLDPEIGNTISNGATNFVTILHEDRTLAIYSHLSRVSPENLDAQVLAGDVIGFTGKSGWIGEVPHLHFQVWARGLKSSLPVVFGDYDGPLLHEELERLGRVYFNQ